jgi:hypothetical protein
MNTSEVSRNHAMDNFFLLVLVKKSVFRSKVVYLRQFHFIDSNRNNP